VRSILTGESLWGKYPVAKTGPVLIVDEETPKSFLRERTTKMGFTPELPLYFLHFQDVRLDRDECFNALIDKIQEVTPVLLVIDSLVRVHRQKEDDAVAMSLVVGRLRKIANTGITLLVIHHHRKGEGPLSQKLRGSSDIPGGVDI
jgi:predicted ATP-dependent serine protease